MSTPYPLAFLSAILKPNGITMDLLRFEETSGGGDGRQWSAELARPLWQVTLSLAARDAASAREVDAKIRGLGTNRPLLFTDPAYDLGGRTPGSAVTVRAISADRAQISLQGLPAGYQVRAGDRFSILHGVRRYFAEFSDGATANASGQTGLLPVTPYPFLSLAAGAAVELVAPVLQAFIPAGGHVPFTTSLGHVAQEASLTLTQKV